jgi:hypothetical protein
VNPNARFVSPSHMYNCVYEKLADTGIAEMMDNEVCLDIHGNIFQTEADAYGRKTNYLLKHPAKLIFVGEVGDKISQKGDGNAGGQKFIVALDTRAQVWNSCKVNHFTVIAFIATDGCLVVCAIIIATSKLRVTDVMGFNPSSKDAEDITDEDMQGLEQ